MSSPFTGAGSLRGDSPPVSQGQRPCTHVTVRLGTPAVDFPEMAGGTGPVADRQRTSADLVFPRDHRLAGRLLTRLRFGLL